MVISHSPQNPKNTSNMWTEILEILAGVLIGAGGTAAAIWIADKIIDKATIKAEVKKKAPSAFKALIEKKKKNAVDVGIFTENDNRIDGITLESDLGISSEIEVGQVLYL